MSTKICFCCLRRRRFRMPAEEAPTEIKNLFEKYSENGDMNVDNLLRFLVEIQAEQNATKEDALAILNSHGHQFRGLHLQGFFNYLFGDSNHPINPNLGVHHDMTAPLSHYFINSGHNSYLTGNQISSDCSDVPIINALQRGVRVIDLQVWPNSTNDDVIVLHGGTLTSPVQLIKCLRSIKEHAFEASDYPVVITIEDHLNANLQAKVAEMIIRTFEDMLFVPRPEGLDSFPSPEQLKRKVIISTTNDLDLEKKKVKRGKVFRLELTWGLEVKYSIDGIQDDKLDEEDIEVDPMFQEIQAPEYRQLIFIYAGKVKGAPDNWSKIGRKKARCVSLSKLDLQEDSGTLAKEIVRFTQHHILRVYPTGTRISSSNYYPFIGWIHGAQMVALNMQEYGKSLWLMQGMFKANGGCGYVKKPDILLNHSEIFDPKARLRVKTTLRVTLYMGTGWYHRDLRRLHFDRYSEPDFFAKVGIIGVPNDTKKMRTKVIEAEWIPTWEEVFQFPLTVPELALLRISVYIDGNCEHDFTSQICIPISELRQGIRAVPLHDHKGEKYKSIKLLMRFELA